MSLRNKFRVTVENRKKIGGYMFTLPFVIGFILFFLYPFIQSVIYSFSSIEFSRTGYTLSNVGFNNYHYSIFVNTQFREDFIETMIAMLTQLPMILAFSFFAAVILNQKFKGRGIARVIFFLPVIYSAGVVLRMETNDIITQMLEANQDSFMFSGEALRALLVQTRFMPEQVIYFILAAVDSIPDIIRSSGIQILIFLAGLQSISPSVYEAAKVEGASGWESFWLITFPMISPLIITNTIYTVVDSLIAANNPLVLLIREMTFSGNRFGVGAAMATMYFASIALILAIIYKLVNKHVFYRE
ncbi:carbohydrate ABC transporter permease [Natronospora cellulosivora (SeqCode)]